MIYPQIPLAQSIIQLCSAKGIKHIVISPGSRNAPLTIGFANNENFKCYSIADERCAAFFALGIAQQLKQPVAVVCTSGSALLNFYPAVAEAFYSQIPLVVISADRPSTKIDIGDGQTIRQQNVFQNHSLFNANLLEEASDENDLLINQAINTAILQCGPVHINAPFEEPLYQTTTELNVDSTVLLAHRPETGISLSEIMSATSIWNNCERKLVIIGGDNPRLLCDEVIQFLADDPSIVVMTEVTSNVHHPKFITNIDAIITPFTEADFLEFQPQLLVTFGGMIVSKRIKSFLRTFKPKLHWHIDTLRAYNTFDSNVLHFKCTPTDFFQKIKPHTARVPSTYSDAIQRIAMYRKQQHDKFAKNAPFSDFTAIGEIVTSLPSDIIFQISNSAPIRYAQLFPINNSIDVFCNRGTSGIDGATSTAIGSAVGSGKKTVLLTGDVSFLYDSNALWNNAIPKNFKIIIINNGGGGIFRILPGHQENEVFNTFFETAHCFTAAHLSAMYQFKYITASDEITLENGLTQLFSDDSQPAILEVFTATKVNDQVLKDYFLKLA